MKYLLVLFALLFLSGCASLTGAGGSTGEPINYTDGTWSKCKFSKDGAEYWLPMQNAPPIGTTQPDGTVISCELIPKTPAS
jgi:hypothetical protein